VILLMLAAYALVGNLYRKTNREVCRLEAKASSPIFSLFGECIDGRQTIRAFGHQPLFSDRMRAHIDNITKHSYARSLCAHFLGTCSDGISVTTNLVACLLILFTPQSKFMLLLSGFALVYLLDLTNAMSWMIMQATTVEADMNRVERIIEYLELEQEAPAEIPQNKPPPDWPSRGAVRFRDFGVRYRDGLPLVLQHFNASFESGQKVATVGRSGAGVWKLCVCVCVRLYMGV